MFFPSVLPTSAFMLRNLSIGIFIPSVAHALFFYLLMSAPNSLREQLSVFSLGITWNTMSIATMIL